MAWAAANGFNFGGVVLKPRHCHKSHGVDTFSSISSLLGQDVSTIFVRAPPRLDFEFGSLDALAANASWLRKCSNVNVGLRSKTLSKKLSNLGNVNVGSRSKKWREKLSKVTREDPVTICGSPPPVTSAFMSALRQGAQFLSRPVSYRHSVLNVALHVRRDDDVTRTTSVAWRYTPNDWYYKLVEKLQESYKGPMDVHVFSSTGLLNKVSHLDGFTSRGMIVHLDGDVLDDWSHMAHADILVMAPSSFSFIPGLFNQKCVLDSHWTRNWTQQFLHFIPVTPTSAYLDSPSFRRDLMTCKNFAKLGDGSNSTE